MPVYRSLWFNVFPCVSCIDHSSPLHKIKICIILGGSQSFIFMSKWKIWVDLAKKKKNLKDLFHFCYIFLSFLLISFLFLLFSYFFPSIAIKKESIFFSFWSFCLRVIFVDCSKKGYTEIWSKPRSFQNIVLQPHIQLFMQHLFFQRSTCSIFYLSQSPKRSLTAIFCCGKAR